MNTRQSEPPQPDAESIGALFARLIEDSRNLAEAELAYYKALGRTKMREARSGLLWGAIAIALALAVAVALVVGLLLSLSPLVGPGLATLIVVVGIGALAGVMGWLAWTHVKRVIGGEP